ILDFQPDGLFLSNGPGDPAPVKYVADTVRELLPKLPVFGICLGHQILGLACGATTFKLKFGHRGGNQPVKDLLTGKVEITSQNHGFAVSQRGLGEAGLELTHVNLNDDTVEGFRHKELPAFAVQYHPEYDLHELARLTFCRIEKLVKLGFFADADAALDYVNKLETLHADPSRQDLAWQLGVDADVMNEDVRLVEVRNWIDRLVLPNMRS
ncbi:MAG: hypothetical protein IH808_13790, partial [Proteobacteria bacterium]|nr:hypothetical protein [Pseudomonadota bacterium]